MSSEGLDYISEETTEDMTEADDGDSDFKKLINQYDENVVNTLMPFMVNILECMNVGYQQKLEYEAKLQKIMTDNIKFQKSEMHAKKMLELQVEEYIAKYETERDARNFLENRIAEYEREKEKERKAMSSRVEVLEIHVQTLEKRFKISTECIEKLEDREAYLKKEYSGLLERYTKLFKEHIEFMEKSNLPRLHRELLSEEFLDISCAIKEEDTTDIDNDTVANDLTVDEAQEGADDDPNTVVNDDIGSDEEQNDIPDEEPDEETPKEDTIEDENTVDEVSLTQSIKNISRIPVKKHK